MKYPITSINRAASASESAAGHILHTAHGVERARRLQRALAPQGLHHVGRAAGSKPQISALPFGSRPSVKSEAATVGRDS